MNNLFFRLALFASACLLFGFHLQANESVQFPTGPAAWTIDLSDSQTNKSIQSSRGTRFTKIDVTQNNGFMRIIITFSNGVTQESWAIAGSSLIMGEDPRGTPFITPVSGTFFIPYLPSSFDWIQPGCLQEKDPIEYQDKKCFHYKGFGPFSPSGGALMKNQTATMEAWIDSETLRPVGLDDGSYLAIFTFGPPPASPLMLPQKFQTLYDGYKKTMGIPKSSGQ